MNECGGNIVLILSSIRTQRIFCDISQQPKSNQRTIILFTFQLIYICSAVINSKESTTTESTENTMAKILL